MGNNIPKAPPLFVIYLHFPEIVHAYISSNVLPSRSLSAVLLTCCDPETSQLALLAIVDVVYTSRQCCSRLSRRVAGKQLRLGLVQPHSLPLFPVVAQSRRLAC